jgi:hypothetical protein
MSDSDEGEKAPASSWMGVLAGVGVALFSIVVGTLTFQSYGWTLFIISPVIIGAAVGYFANYKHVVSPQATRQDIYLTAIIAGVVLIAFAFEGLICIVMAAPLMVGLMVLGGVGGRSLVLRSRHKVRDPLMAIVALPLAFASEQTLSLSTAFVTEEAIEIAAPADAVWRSLVDMGEIATRPALPFRLGIAYPVRASIDGEGVGATRIGEFSTGAAVERITAWEPNQRLAFDVLSEPPPMTELSPYTHVYATHLAGYFRTLSTSFELVPLPDGRTRVVEQTAHLLKLEPAGYWLPMARWLIHWNNTRVLEHVRDRAEDASRQ